MLTIRLARHGAKKKPLYHITVAERTAPRDGRFVERVGFYNPVARGNARELQVDLERVDHWLGVGAQPTERVRQLVARWRKLAAVGALEQPGAARRNDGEQASVAEAEAETPTETTDE